MTGKSMVSMHKSESPYPVYHITEWLSDKWDPRDYGRDFDFKRTFFEQFKELCDAVPHHNLFVDPQLDVNSDYTNCADHSKNCYLLSQAENNEDVYYTRGANTCKDCVDCLRIQQCELCYEGVSLFACYGCMFCQNCENSVDCYFSSDLKNCKNCFGCHGLVQKQYYYFNQPLSKEEWELRMKSLKLTNKSIEEIRAQSEAVRLSMPHRATYITQCEDVSGDNLVQCKDSRFCYDSKNLEGCAYCYEILNGAKYCYDYSMWGVNAELLYECNACGANAYNLLFSDHCWQGVSNLIYCDDCYPSVKDCFGCFGLRRSQYCILNKQYTKEEYDVMVARIIEHMQKTGEWGEFFPSSISPYAYNETSAHLLIPLSKDQVLAKGWNWYEKDEAKEEYIGPALKIPESILDVEDGLTKQILRCSKTGKLYKVIPQELAFYRKMNLPVPLICPEQRLLNRGALRNPRYLWPRSCAECSSAIQSTYAPNRPEKVLCEACYLKTVY
ncbi:hypothetical protein IPG41_05885 [Candidatus Peregrinibacteria bacterium]|nr:MAG: hypothetical protein IPG41_05885 [Candidatus Peregrinibacteria bacterium]